MAELTGEDLAHLAEFRARLRAVRRAKRHGGGMQDLALRLSVPGISGIAPVLCRRTPRPRRRGEETEGAMSFLPGLARKVVPTGAVKPAADVATPLEGFRAVLAAARQEAAQGRARRERERAVEHLPPRGGNTERRAFAPARRGGPADVPEVEGGRAALAAPAFARPVSRVSATGPEWRRGEALPPAATAGITVGKTIANSPFLPADRGCNIEVGATSSEMLAPVMARPREKAAGEDLAQALQAYFFRQSRLPPAGGTGFDPRLTPAWAGVKIPG